MSHFNYKKIVSAPNLDEKELKLVIEALLNKLDLKILKTERFDHGDEPWQHKIDFSLIPKSEVVETQYE